MQLDMFGATEESANRGAAPPVVSPAGAWVPPEALVFNAALKAGSLGDAIAILNRLKVGAVLRVLLASGFSVGASDTRAKLIADVQSDILAAVKLRLTGAELWESRAVAHDIGSDRPITSIRVGETVRKDGFNYVVVGPIDDGVAAQRTISAKGGITESKTVLLSGNDAIDAKIAFAKYNVAERVDGLSEESPAVLTAPARERITSQMAAAMTTGMRVVDGVGKEYQAFSARFAYLEAFPIRPDGKAEVFAGNAVFFHLDTNTAEAYPKRRHDAIYLVDDLSIANHVDAEQNTLIDNAAVAADEQENHDGRIDQAGNLRGANGAEHRGNGVDVRVGSESLDDGLAGSGGGATEGGNLSSVAGSASGPGEGHSGERNGSFASVATGDLTGLRDRGISAGDRRVDLAVNVTVSAARVATRQELNMLLVTEMTDDQLLQAKVMFADGKRANSIARQIAKRALESVATGKTKELAAELTEIFGVIAGADGKLTLENEESVIAGNGDGSPRKFATAEVAYEWAVVNGYEVKHQKDSPTAPYLTARSGNSGSVAATVKLPAAISDAIAAELAGQDARITRLRSTAKADGVTLAKKLILQAKAEGAESALQQMRSAVFAVEDAAAEAIAAADVSMFGDRAIMFPGVNAAIAAHLASLTVSVLEAQIPLVASDVELASISASTASSLTVDDSVLFSGHIGGVFHPGDTARVRALAKTATLFTLSNGGTAWMDHVRLNRSGEWSIVDRGPHITETTTTNPTARPGGADLLDSRSRAAGLALIVAVANELNGTFSEWELQKGWQYADLTASGAKIRVGVSDGGVVQVNRSPFTAAPEQAMHITVGAVRKSVVAAIDIHIEQQAKAALANQSTTPAWHTDIPKNGLPINESELSMTGFREVAPRIANEAVAAITQEQKLGVAALYAYVLPAQDGANGRARLIAEDQAAPAGWSLLNPGAYRIGMLSDEQIVARLTKELGNAPVIGVKQEITAVASVSPVIIKTVDQNDFVAALNQGNIVELMSGQHVKLIQIGKHGWNYAYNYPDAPGFWAEGALPVVPGASIVRGKSDAINAAQTKFKLSLVAEIATTARSDRAGDLRQDARVSPLEVRATIERNAIAKRYAEVLAEGRVGVSPNPVEFHFKFADDILAKNAYGLKWTVNGLNDKSKKVFTEFTGTKLPRAQGAAWETLKEWGGVTLEQDAAVNSRVAVARGEKRLEAADAEAEFQATAQKFRASASDATVITGKDLVDRQLSEGHTEIRNISTTRIPKYVLVNPAADRFYPLDKARKVYAEVALRRLGKSIEVSAGDGDRLLSVEQGVANDAEHARELADAQAQGQTIVSAEDAAHLFGRGPVPAYPVDEPGDAVAAVTVTSMPAATADPGKTNLVDGIAIGDRRISSQPGVEASLIARHEWDSLSNAQKSDTLRRAGWRNGEGEVSSLARQWLTMPWSDIAEETREIITRTLVPDVAIAVEGTPTTRPDVAELLDLGDAGEAGRRAVSRADYSLTDDDRIGEGGLAEKFQDNLRAIQILRTLDAEKRHAVGGELRTLARYVGWGGLKGVFDLENKQWARQHTVLRALLSDAEWAAASRSQLDAFYTAPVVTKAMYSGVSRLGFGHGRILEPSVGVGNFYGLMPEAMRQQSALHGVELDILTSQIVAALYPSAKIAKATGFQAYNVPAGYFDMVIGNPPFGSQTVSDEKGSAYSGWSIHNYFFAKSIDMLRPGGIMPMVVSHNFLDKLDPHVRQWIARRAELVSGVRLPNTAFKQNANTEVVTDVLIFRRLDNENMLGKQELPDWLDTSQVSIENSKTGEFEAISINNYFINNPQNVLGVNSTESSMYRANEYTVTPNGELEVQLAQWVASLPEGIYQPVERTVKDLELAAVEIPEFVKEGSFFSRGDGVIEVWQRLGDLGGEQRAVRWIPANQRALERMTGMIAIRDVLRSQMRLERAADAGEGAIEAGRRELNRVYDSFRRKNGFVNDPLNRRLFLDDTESALIQALEFDYEKAISPAKAEEYGIEERPARAVKADIFSRRVLFPPGEIEVVETAKDALLHSLNYTGGVDMAYMQRAYGKDEQTIVAELGDLLFVDPVEGRVTADEYLSGDVKTKLAEATKAVRGDPSLSRNVEALEKVIPGDKLPSEIHAAIGAAWIPPQIFADFAKEISGAKASFNYISATGHWLGHAQSEVDFAKNNNEYGVAKMGALEIFTSTMNSRAPEIKRKVVVDGQERYVTDEEQTEAVRQRADKIKSHWDSWLWADGDRVDQLTALYNKKFNRTVERHYDGSHLTFPGMSPYISLLSHQKDGAWRGLQDRSMLLDQVVGAGKTFEMVAMAMEMRRLGITKKPMFGVPNHLTLQWRSEFYRLYPGANVLAATPQDFDKENRERFFAKIVTGNWDAVIVGHSSLKKIAVPLEAEMKIVTEQFDDITDAIKALKKARGDNNIIRDMEKIKGNLEAKMTRLKEKGGKKDNVVDFGDLGVDALFIDEMHEFKNLFFTTQMDRVAGLGNPAGSGKAFDLFVKIRWLQETFGEGAPLITATGTPISNSLAEMFTMQRYMQYARLKANNLHVFDAWAKQYGDVQNVYEVAPSGTGFRLSQRFAKFKNLPSLMGEYRSFADVITLDHLKAQEAALGKVFPVPKLEGGRPLNVIARRSELQEKFFGIPEIVRTEAGDIQFGINLDLPPAIVKVENGKFEMHQQEDEHIRRSKRYDTAEEAAYMTALGAITPVMTIDPESIVGQFENLRQLTRSTNGKINALSLTGLANKAGLDYRLIDPRAVDFPDSKVNEAVRNILHTAKQWDADKGVQLIFCDLSVPLSAKAKMASKDKRIYVRDAAGNLTHKKGTLHALKDYDGLPYYLVAFGKGNAKTFTMYDPVTGQLMKDGLDSKHDAQMFLSKFVKQEGGQERWLDMREQGRPIGADEIDEYKNEHTIDADGDATDMEISMQDVEGATVVSGFSIYDDMKAKLIAGGIPATQIEFIHDHDTPQAKDLLFKRVNAGDVRHLFGSTPKMGAGTNVQQRVVALHHIDAPWRPSDLEQREGRVIRRGNMLYERDPEGFRVAVYRYATAQTYDTRRWQLLEHKASGLEQLRNYAGVNELDDVANEAANSADMKAAASGNPLILRETQLRTEVRKLQLLKGAHWDGEFMLRSRMNSARNYVEEYGPNALKKLQVFRSEIDGSQVLAIYGGKKLEDKDQVMSAIDDIAAKIALSDQLRTLIYRGLKFQFKRNESEFYPVRMRMPNGFDSLMETLSRSGSVTRMDNWCADIDRDISQVEKWIGKHNQEADEAEKMLGKPFEQAEILEATINEHGKVQRALMKSNSMAAVKPAEAEAFRVAVENQKKRLRECGLGDAVDEIEREDQEGIALSVQATSTSRPDRAELLDGRTGMLLSSPNLVLGVDVEVDIAARAALVASRFVAIASTLGVPADKVNIVGKQCFDSAVKMAEKIAKEADRDRDRCGLPVEKRAAPEAAYVEWLCGFASDVQDGIIANNIRPYVPLYEQAVMADSVGVRKGGTPLTDAEKSRNDLAGVAGELAMQLDVESDDRDFVPTDALTAVRNWVKGQIYSEQELRQALIIAVESRGNFRMKATVLKSLRQVDLEALTSAAVVSPKAMSTVGSRSDGNGVVGISEAGGSLFGLSGAQIEAMQGGKLRGAEQFPGVSPALDQIEARKQDVLVARELERADVDAAGDLDLRIAALRDGGIPAAQVLRAAKELSDGDDVLMNDLARIGDIGLPVVFSCATDVDSLPGSRILAVANRLDVGHVKTRMVDALPGAAPAGWFVMNAPRPLFGTQTLEGEFVTGRFYATIDPDDSMAAWFVTENQKLDARLLVAVSRETQMELAMHGNKYRDKYLDLGAVDRYVQLSSKLEKLRDLTYGELTKAILEAKGVVTDGRYNGVVISVADGVVTQKINRDGGIACHDATRMMLVVAVGDLVDIVYRGGRADVKTAVKAVSVGR